MNKIILYQKKHLKFLAVYFEKERRQHLTQGQSNWCSEEEDENQRQAEKDRSSVRWIFNEGTQSAFKVVFSKLTWQNSMLFYVLF